MSIDLWVTFCLGRGGAIDEEPSYLLVCDLPITYLPNFYLPIHLLGGELCDLLVPELSTCLRPTSFLPTHSSLGVGGGERGNRGREERRVQSAGSLQQQSD
jgi:hypothetical protein